MSREDPRQHCGRLVVLLAACLLSTSVTILLSPAGEGRAAPAVTLPDSAWIMAQVRYLADPRQEGRGVGTEGLARAADFIEREFRELGLAPAGEDGGWRQRVEVVTGVEVHEPTDLLAAGRRYAVERDFQALGFSASGEAAAPVVFAGYGITAPEFEYDDYTGLDVHDRFVLVLHYEPGEMDPHSRFEGDINTPHSELRTKAINAREHGALGLLVVTGPRYHPEEPELLRPRADAGYMSSGILAAHLSREVADDLLRGSGWTLAGLQDSIDVHQRPLGLALGDSVRLRISLAKRRAFVDNVVGVLRGTDTTRTMVVGAHYDHLGSASDRSLSPDDPGSIHHGADDNASGTAALLAIARAWTSRPAPPRHNLVFCAFTAEELGLLGSHRYVNDPPFPLETTDLMMNLDMVGRLRENRLVVMGSGSASGLDSLIVRAAAPLGLDVRLVESGQGPSDHMSFNNARVPVMALFTGAHADYHKPSDTWDKVDGAGIARVARYAFSMSELLDPGPALAWQETAASPQFRGVGGGSGHGAYLGTIPDYTQTEGGVLLSDVRDGGPADEAGIRGGDVVVSFDGVRVDNIYDYTYALRTRRPGQQVEIGILRGGERLTVTAVLGKRERSR